MPCSALNLLLSHHGVNDIAGYCKTQCKLCNVHNSPDIPVQCIITDHPSVFNAVGWAKVRVSHFSNPKGSAFEPGVCGDNLLDSLQGSSYPLIWQILTPRPEHLEDSTHT